MTELNWLALLSDEGIYDNTSLKTSSILASTDAEAIRIWLQAKASRSAHTFTSYRKEALRLLVWMHEHTLTLQELKVEHIHRYFEHLATPPSHWIRPVKPRKREALHITQLLLGPLSARSIEYCRTVLMQMFSYLIDAGYLRRNVIKLSMRIPVFTSTVHTRLLDVESWQWFWHWLQQPLSNSTPRQQAHSARCRWLFALLYHTGIRLEEATRGRMNDFYKGENGWFLRVIGKGRKERWVSVNSLLMDECLHYRRSLGIASYPSPLDEFPLIAPLHANRIKKNMTPRAVALIISTMAQKAAHECTDPHIQTKLLQLSTHWMRHTNATHRLLAGASLETTQDELGHNDPRTTRIYAATLDLQRQEDAEKLAQLHHKAKLRKFTP